MIVTEKFTGKADVYAKYRPDYPAEYIEYLIQFNHLNASSVIADVGSGTGKLTRQLLERGLTVIAVEPNDHMRAVAESGLHSFQNYISLGGSAEETGIRTGSIDLVTVAQAFHWFDAAKFKKECRRILKPDAYVALVWNCRNFASLLNVENEELCGRLCGEFKGFNRGFNDMAELNLQFFRDGTYNYREFPCSLEYDLEGFIGRNLSASYAPSKTDPAYDEFVEEVTRLFDRYRLNDKLLVPMVTRCYTGRV